jgi:hypothetical protein
MNYTKPTIAVAHILATEPLPKIRIEITTAVMHTGMKANHIKKKRVLSLLYSCHSV